MRLTEALDLPSQDYFFKHGKFELAHLKAGTEEDILKELLKDHQLSLTYFNHSIREIVDQGKTSIHRKLRGFYKPHWPTLSSKVKVVYAPRAKELFMLFELIADVDYRSSEPHVKPLKKGERAEFEMKAWRDPSSSRSASVHLLVQGRGSYVRAVRDEDAVDVTKFY